MAVQNYATMHDLRAQTLLADGNIAVVAGYYAPGDGGGGTYRYSSSSTDPLDGGLANAVFARAGLQVAKSAFPWGLNASGLRLASRFQLPSLDTASGGDAAGMGWQMPPSTLAAADVRDGEVYYDESTDSVLGRAKDAWYQLAQPERVATNPGSLTWDASREKNLAYDDNSTVTVTLDTDQAKVPRGSVVRVFNFHTTIGLNVTVKVGTVTIDNIGIGKMSEYVFYVDGSGNSKWLATQRSVSAGRF